MVRRRALLRLLGSLRLFEVADIQVVLKLGGCHNMQCLCYGWLREWAGCMMWRADKRRWEKPADEEGTRQI